MYTILYIIERKIKKNYNILLCWASFYTFKKNKERKKILTENKKTKKRQKKTDYEELVHVPHHIKKNVPRKREGKNVLTV